MREILRAGVGGRKEFVYVVLEATGFLRYMVRTSWNTRSGGNREAHERRVPGCHGVPGQTEAGPTAPAKGLFLREIKY